MPVKLLIAALLSLGLGTGLAAAQPVGHDPARDPVQGTRGRHVSRTRPSAQALAKADKQPPGTENGNQPDRAAAGGGGR